MAYKNKEDHNRHQLKSYHRRYATEDGRIKILINDARRRAKKKGHEFDDRIKEELTSFPALCPLKEIDLSLEGGRDNSPSIDRIDPSKGYVPGNVWFISDRANRLKRDGTLEEFELMVKNWRARVDSRKE